MSVSVGLEQARLLGGARRQELVECLPALRESRNERVFRVGQLTRLADIARASGAIRATPAQPVVWVRRLLGRPVLGLEQQHLGHVRDVVARQLPDGIGTVVTGLIADAGGHRLFAPAATVRDLQTRRVVLRVFLIRPAGCRLSTEQHLRARDMLGRPVMTAPDRPPSRISDIALRRTPAGWTVWAVDTRTTVQRLLGSPRRLIEWDGLAMRRLATPPGSTDAAVVGCLATCGAQGAAPPDELVEWMRVVGRVA